MNSSNASYCWSSSELRRYIHTSIKTLGLKPSRHFGQNFLIDASVIRFHLSQASLTPSDVVLEIGPGLGNLTKCIIPQVKKVFVIESDRKIYAFLCNKFSVFSNVECIFGDAIKVEWPKFSKCLSNLPYQISSPITFKLFKHNFELAVLMYQKEFAERLIAQPGSKQYSRLSVMLSIHAYCDYLLTIKPTSFYPSPKVESALVKITPHKPLVQAEEFPSFVTSLFNNKGRTVRAVVKRLLKNYELSSSNSEQILNCLGDLSSRRVFTLSTSEIISLYKRLEPIIKEAIH